MAFFWVYTQRPIWAAGITAAPNFIAAGITAAKCLRRTAPAEIPAAAGCSRRATLLVGAAHLAGWAKGLAGSDRIAVGKMRGNGRGANRDGLGTATGAVADDHPVLAASGSCGVTTNNATEQPAEQASHYRPSTHPAGQRHSQPVTNRCPSMLASSRV